LNNEFCFRLALRKLKRPYRMLWDPAQTGQYTFLFEFIIKGTVME
jgi:hypothetical protein